jgi:hypothetical protein
VFFRHAALYRGAARLFAIIERREMSARRNGKSSRPAMFFYFFAAHNVRLLVLSALAEESGFHPTPKEQPPRKLSGKRTVREEHSGKQVQRL